MSRCPGCGRCQECGHPYAVTPYPVYPQAPVYPGTNPWIYPTTSPYTPTVKPWGGVYQNTAGGLH